MEVVTIPTPSSRTLFDQFVEDCRAALDAVQRTCRLSQNDQALRILTRRLLRRYVDLIPTLTDASQPPEGADEPRLDALFSFLDQYAFTPTEGTLADSAIDLEMAGRVCERLVGTPETTHSRAEAGIFYTPHVEIDLMSRLALADWLAAAWAASTGRC